MNEKKCITDLKILFIVKLRQAYGELTHCYGLVNSCNFVVSELTKNNIKAEVVQVVDANSIDRELTLKKPSICFIEALWVTPSKLRELCKLHPSVHFIVRIHSMIPFLVTEGISMEWIASYIELARKDHLNISVAGNNLQLVDDLQILFNHVILYAPNIYVAEPITSPSPIHICKDRATEIHIGCFGALRPLKNTAQQAVWAVHYANMHSKQLHFHVNASEHEQVIASPVLKNLQSLFNVLPHKLVIHPWYNHSDFLSLVSQMDIGMQISFSETFNIVAADFIYCQVPIVVSSDIDYITSSYRVDPSDTEGAIKALDSAAEAIGDNRIAQTNWRNLQKFNRKASQVWLDLLSKYSYAKSDHDKPQAKVYRREEVNWHGATKLRSKF